MFPTPFITLDDSLTIDFRYDKICYFIDYNLVALVKYSPYPLAYLQSSVPSEKRAGHLSRCQKMGSRSPSLSDRFKRNC